MLYCCKINLPRVYDHSCNSLANYMSDIMILHSTPRDPSCNSLAKGSFSFTRWRETSFGKRDKSILHLYAVCAELSTLISRQSILVHRKHVLPIYEEMSSKKKVRHPCNNILQKMFLFKISTSSIATFQESHHC